MRTKLTLYAVTVFISSLKYKLIIIFLILNSAFSFSQTCSANLDVSKGRKTRSTSSSGTYYKMTITNNGIITINQFMETIVDQETLEELKKASNLEANKYVSFVEKYGTEHGVINENKRKIKVPYVSSHLY